VIRFKGGRGSLLETAPGVTVKQVLAATEASLTFADTVRTMPIQHGT